MMHLPLIPIKSTFGKEEKLKLRKDIETLFRTGKAFSILPIRVIYRIKVVDSTTIMPIQVGVSVPKKRFKHAVDRNAAKRIIKENWRLQKHILLPLLSNQYQLQLFFVYQANKLPHYSEIELIMPRIISKLEEILHLHNQQMHDQTSTTLDH